MIAGVIPFKGGAEGKTRLACALPAPARRRLNYGMFENVLGRLRSSTLVDRVYVVCPYPLPGADTIHDPGRGLNAALQAAIDVCLDGPAEAILILPADLPYLSNRDVEAMVAMGTHPGSGVVAPSKDGGTGGLLLKRDAMIEPAFGEGSGSRHITLLAATGSEPEVVHRSGLALDIDLPEDLDLLGDQLLDVVWGGDSVDPGRSIGGL